ncbi:glutamyl-tRNA reductase [Bradyrhizobium sp. GM22.5]
MTQLHGIYIDHHMSSPLTTAQLSAEIKSLAKELARSGIILLATCVRVEMYGDAAAIRNIESTIFSGLSYERIEGSVAIARRLAEICIQRSLTNPW